MEDEDYQLTHERTFGIDIAKDKADIAVRLPPERDGGRRTTRTWTLPSTFAAITGLGAQLAGAGAGLAVPEATSDYRRSWFYLPEAAGLNVRLVSPSHAKQLAGRPETGKLDCQRLARLAETGLLRASFAPPPAVRALRGLTRACLHLTRDRTRERQRPEKLLEGALIRLSSAAGKMAGNKSVLKILQAIVDGERDPGALAALAHGRRQGRPRRRPRPPGGHDARAAPHRADQHALARHHHAGA